MAYALPVEPESKRKPNFTDAEKLFLLHQYELYKPILSSRLCDGVTNRQKHEIWMKITAQLNNRNPHVDRTTKDVKKKWENLATQARKEMIDCRQTEGATLPSTVTMKVLELLDEIPGAGGFQTSLHNDDREERGPCNMYLEPLPADSVSFHGDKHNCAQAAIEIDASNEIPHDYSTPDSNDQLIMKSSYHRPSISPELADANGASNETQILPTRSPGAQSTGSSCKRSREDRDQEDHRSAFRNETKKLKRLKLLLETEKLMLEKRKLELEILLLNNQLKKDAA